MSTDPRARRMASIGGLLLLGLACVLYVFIMNAIVGRSPSGGVPSGDSGARIATELDKLLPGFVIVLLWIMLAILLFLRGGGSQKMPPQALVAATILLPLSGVAAIYAANLYALYAGWAIVVPALLPPLIAFYAMWARLPALQAALPANITSAGAWGAILVLTIAPVPLSAIDASTYAAGQPERQRQVEARMAANDQLGAQMRERDIARFQALNADSPLGDYLRDLGGPSYSPLGDYLRDLGGLSLDRPAGYEEALAKARQVKSRQSDVVALLEEPSLGDTRARGRGEIEYLEDLWRLDIEATPAVCKAYGDALRQEAENARKYSHDQRDDYAWDVREALERQLPNMKWLIREHCDLGDTLAVVETRVRELCEPDRCPDTNYDGHRALAFLDTLAALRRPH